MKLTGVAARGISTSSVGVVALLKRSVLLEGTARDPLAVLFEALDMVGEMLM